MKSNKFRHILLVLFGLFFSNSTYPCAVGQGQNISVNEVKKKYVKGSRKISSTEIAPFAKGHCSPSWESKLGNLLLENYYDASTSKIVLSIPAQLPKGEWPHFGDGQKNAKMEFGSEWTGTDFPVVGIETTMNGQKKRFYRFSPSLKVEKYQEKVLPDGWYQVRPQGQDKAFYFSFQTSAMPISEFINGVPEEFRTFPDNRKAPNISQISKQDPLKQLNESDLGPGFNSKNAWKSKSVHGIFPGPIGAPTALGGVITWGVATEPHDRPQKGPFKFLYTCFDPRNAVAESAQGIPSGAGWHYVGDPAESVLNSLSEMALPFAVGRSHDQKDSALDLTESVTAMWLQSDEIQVTRQGEFHWYLNPYEQNVCTEIWVHNCVPNLTNNWGFKKGCQ